MVWRSDLTQCKLDAHVHIGNQTASFESLPGERILTEQSLWLRGGTVLSSRFEPELFLFFLPCYLLAEDSMYLRQSICRSQAKILDNLGVSRVLSLRMI